MLLPETDSAAPLSEILSVIQALEDLPQREPIQEALLAYYRQVAELRAGDGELSIYAN